MRYLKLLTLVLLTFVVAACNGDVTVEEDPAVEVTAMHDHEENLHLFEMSTHEVPSGWTTFQFNNASAYDHFFLIYKVPEEGIEAANEAGEPLLDHWYQGITEPFQMAYNPFVDGEIDYGQFTENLVGAISEKAPWFFDPGAVPTGGPGFTAAGSTSRTTVNLEPGEYVVECYVKDENEVFHSYIGMLELLTVTDDISEVEQPEPTAHVSISSENGIQFDQLLNPGSHIIEIHFVDQASYDHLLGHNVQLVKLSDKEDEELLNNLAEWMDWRPAGSLVDTAPEGADFMGGSMEMAEGATAFFHTDLDPGDYAWIAEIPNPADHGLLVTFTVEEDEAPSAAY